MCWYMMQYECGDPLGKFTIAYLDPSSLKCAAVATILLTALNIVLVHGFCLKMESLYSESSSDSEDSAAGVLPTAWGHV